MFYPSIKNYLMNNLNPFSPSPVMGEGEGDEVKLSKMETIQKYKIRIINFKRIIFALIFRIASPPETG